MAAAGGGAAAAGPPRETLELSDTSLEAQRRHAALLLKLEAQRRARTVAAPTDTEEVKTKLRELGHPITLFGEGPADRRERLKLIMGELEVQAMIEREGVAAVTAAAADAQAAYQTPAAVAAAAAASGAAAAPAAEKAQLFYTPGSEELALARRAIAEFSFMRAASRVAEAARVAADPAAAAAEDAAAGRLYARIGSMRAALSQVADERPLSCMAVSRGGEALATGSWSGVVRIWGTRDASLKAALKGHTERVVGLAWHPAASLSARAGGGPCLLASAAADGTARLWELPVADIAALGGGGGAAPGSAAGEGPGASMDEEGASGSGSAAGVDARALRARLTETGLREAACLKGHAARLSSVAFHPSGRYVGTTSFDKTWRLWDVESRQELLLQEGHAREVYPIAFHPDGSLAATGDLSGLGRVWDLRSGKSVFVLKGHTAQLLALDWSPNGTSIVSGSEDHSCCVWDLRQQRTLYTLPAHAGIVSRVKFAPASGEYLATASFDGSVKLWCARDWHPLGPPLLGHEGRVVGLDIAEDDEGRLFTAGYDRTFKAWETDSPGL